MLWLECGLLGWYMGTDKGSKDLTHGKRLEPELEEGDSSPPELTDMSGVAATIAGSMAVQSFCQSR